MNKLLTISLLSIITGVNAQSVGNSPYSAFGIGDVKYNNDAELSAMAKTGTAYIWDFNNSFNFQNPAANANFQLTSIKAQGTNENLYFKSDYNNIDVTKHSNYLSNLTLAFPISKSVKFGATFQPYSSKQYDILTTTELADGTKKVNSFVGDGTINALQAAVGYSFNSKLAFGFRANYYFGNVTDLEEIAYSNAPLTNGFYTHNNVKSLNFTLASAYQTKLKNDNKITFGATYTFGNIGNFDTEFTNSTYYYYNGAKAGETVIEKKESSDKGLIPSEFSLAVGYGKELKWFVSTQMDYKSGTDVQFLGEPFSYENSYRFSAGGWYIPNINNFRNYFSRVIYRYGLFYEKGNLTLNGKDINQYGLTLGATLPFQKSSASRMTGLDVALELGRKGTKSNDLIGQNYFNIKFGINFADKWFKKVYYD